MKTLERAGGYFDRGFPVGYPGLRSLIESISEAVSTQSLPTL